MSNKQWYKKNENDKVWWLDNYGETVGEWIFSFDKQKEFNLFADYPHKLTASENTIFDNENPYWKEFFKDREQQITK